VTDTEHYDALIIGAGQAGGPLSVALANAGMRTALVEREHVGGTCINTGCTPTKTMIASARAAYVARHADRYGVQTGEVRVDLSRVVERKREVVERFRSGSERRIRKSENTDLYEGEASFESPEQVVIRLNDGREKRIRAGKIFINTGGRPAVPPLAGLSDVPFLNSTTIMDLTELPEHLLILGGGYIAVEFGQMFCRFGSAVTIVQRGPYLLNREDPDVADAIADILREDGIDIVLNAEAEAVAQSDGRIYLTVNSPDGRQTLAGSHLLVAVGRVPNTERLNLAAAGVETDERGYIRVNDRLETSQPGIYALGDVNGGPALTHVSYDDFRIIRANLLENGSRSRNDRLVPYTVFIDPQLGRVGLTETEAKKQGRRYRVARMPMKNVARADEIGETRGFMKVLVDDETGELLGAAVLGIEGGELMSMLEIAMLGRVPYHTLRDAVFAHPTLAEAFNNLFARLE